MAAQGQQIASMFARIGADTSDFQKGMGDVQSQLGKGEKSFAKFGLSGVINIAKIAAALAALKKGYDFAQQGAQLSRLEDAGASLARSYGANMNQILGALKTASRGTVAETDLILSANRAMMLGVSTDADQMANLLEVAALRGRAMGLSTTQAFNDIVTGIGRMSPLILDNLGIVTNLSARVEEWAKKNGVAADSVDDATKRQILLNAVLEDGNKQLAETGGLVDDAASSYERFGAAASDAWSRLMKIAGVAGGSIVGASADALIELNKTNAALDALGARRLRYGFAELPTGEFVHFTELLQRMNHVVLTSKDSYDAFDKSVREAGGSFSGWSADMQRWMGWADMQERLSGVADGFGEISESAEAAEERIKAFYDIARANPLDDILSAADASEFYRLGGEYIAAYVDGVRTQIANAGGDISGALAEPFETAALQSAALQVALGNLTTSQAMAELNKLPVPIEDARNKLADFVALLEAEDGKKISMYLDLDTNIPFGLLQQVLGLSRGQTADAMRYTAQAKNQRAMGGLISGNEVYSVGENGEEGVIPLGNGAYWVIPNQEWMKMKKAGAVPSAGFMRGGIMDGGGDAGTGGGYVAPPPPFVMPTNLANKPQSQQSSSMQSSAAQSAAAATQAAAAAAVGVGTSVAQQQQQSNMAVIGALTRQSSEESQRINLSLEELRLAMERLPLSIAAEISHELAIRNAQ